MSVACFDIVPSCKYKDSQNVVLWQFFIILFNDGANEASGNTTALFQYIIWFTADSKDRRKYNDGFVSI